MAACVSRRDKQARRADSMAMSVLTGVGLLCYAANLYLLLPPGRRGPQGRGRLLSPRSLMAALPRSYTGGPRAAGPGSEECGSEEQLGPGEIGQFFLHGSADRLPRTAHDPLIYGGERPHNCGSELRQPPRRVV